MNSSINVNRLSIPKVLGDIARTYNINFVNYSQYSKNTITVYRSGDPNSYQQFLKDDECHLPLKLS